MSFLQTRRGTLWKALSFTLFWNFLIGLAIKDAYGREEENPPPQEVPPDRIPPPSSCFIHSCPAPLALCLPRFPQKISIQSSEYPLSCPPFKPKTSFSSVISPSRWSFLTKITLQGCGLQIEALQPLRDHFFFSLTSLNLAGNQLGDEGAGLLGQLSRGLKSLTHLDLSGNGIKGGGMAELTEGSFPALTHLLLAHNPIGDWGISSLVFFSHHFPKLSYLDVSSANLTERSADMLSESTEFSLETLIIAHNLIRWKIGRLVRYNLSLIFIDASWNDINDDDAYNLVSYRPYSALERLDLTGNPLKRCARYALANAFHSDQKLLILFHGEELRWKKIYTPWGIRYE